MKALVLGAILTALAAGSAAAAPDPAKGQAVYEDRCSLCHPAEAGGQGPPLKGVVGRTAGSAPGFPYTDALKASHLTWTPVTLNTFLSGPAKMVPGTTMAITVPDPAERAELIAYLGAQK